MLLRCLKAELVKFHRSPVWLAFVLLPVFPAILGTVNYLGNIEVLENAWYSLWSQHTLFSSMFFLPALLSVFCAWQWRLEHTDHNWNSFLTAPVPMIDLCLAKLIWAALVSLLAQVWIGVLFVLSGKLAGISVPLPPELPEWLLCGAVGGVTVCAVQLYFSLRIRAFAPPVAFGLVGGIAGLMATAQGFGYAFPYSLRNWTLCPFCSLPASTQQCSSSWPSDTSDGMMWRLINIDVMGKESGILLDRIKVNIGLK